MKKAILNLLMLFAVTGVATAQTVTVANVEACHGRTETIKATLELTAPEDTYTGVQLYIQFPTTGFSNVVKGAGTSFGNIQVGAMTDGKVKIAAAADDFFEDATIVVQFTVDGSLDLGEYPVTVSGQFEATGVVDPIADVPFKVIVTDRITLDENSTTAPIARTGVNVKVNRTIKAGEWSTICLPFTMTKSQAETVFGSDVTVKTFTGYTATIDELTLIPSAIVMNFADYNLSALKPLKAGNPYLIKTSKDISSFELDGVNVSSTTSDVSVKETNYELDGKFKGVLAKTTVPDKGLFISGNKFYYSTGKTNIKAFRGWFELQAIIDSPVSFDARIDFNFDETTGIKEVHGSANVEGTYDLQGRKVEEPVKGLYIVNGRKVVKK